jgi:hypothetical protein
MYTTSIFSFSSSFPSVAFWSVYMLWPFCCRGFETIKFLRGQYVNLTPNPQPAGSGTFLYPAPHCVLHIAGEMSSTNSISSRYSSFLPCRLCLPQRRDTIERVTVNYKTLYDFNWYTWSSNILAKEFLVTNFKNVVQLEFFLKALLFCIDSEVYNCKNFQLFQADIFQVIVFLILTRKWYFFKLFGKLVA